MWLLVVGTFAFVVASDGSTSYPTVKTSSGNVQGKTLTTLLKKEVDVFLGIPYAQPPLQKLRFKPPLEIEPWNGIFNATVNPLTCFQNLHQVFTGNKELNRFFPFSELSEDCLKLNIWVPKDKSDKTSVMVFIYGGGFSNGGISSSMYDGSVLATEEKIIVVSINHRVASLGFLFLDHPDIPGNAGLYDQLLALKWIKRNIALFGGDPESITLFGESSGAASVGYHLHNTLSSGLFNKAIMQSGSPNAFWALSSKEKAIKNAMILVENLGCSYALRKNITQIIDCLQTASAEDIVNNEPVRGLLYHFSYFPVIDGKIVPDDPTKIIASESFAANIPLLTGTVKDEGSIFLSLYDPIVFSPFHDFIAVHANDLFKFSRFFGMDVITDALIVFLYFDNVSLLKIQSAKYLEALIKISSDYGFNCPLEKFVSVYSKSGNDVFKYHFSHRTNHKMLAKWMGTTHGDELFYVFGDPFRNHTMYTVDEEILSRRVMRYWSNFAKTGTPNPATSYNDDVILWPQYTSDGREYLILSPNSTSVGKSFRKQICTFWLDLRPELTRLVSEIVRAKTKKTSN